MSDILEDFKARIGKATTQMELEDISFDALKASGKIDFTIGSNAKSLWDKVVALCVEREQELSFAGIE